MELKDIEFKRLVKDVRYWKEEYQLKKDMAYSIENMFNSALDEFLEKNPSVKSKWESFMEKKTKQIEFLIKQKYTESDTKIEESEKITFIEEIKKELSPKDKEIKRLYREIVKLTHPDKLHIHSEGDKEKRLLIYKESTQYYQNSDLSNIIYCADELGIKYDSSLVDIEIIKKDIELFKQKALMYENSIFWKWYREDKNESIITHYLTQQME